MNRGEGRCQSAPNTVVRRYGDQLLAQNGTSCMVTTTEAEVCNQEREFPCANCPQEVEWSLCTGSSEMGIATHGNGTQNQFPLTTTLCYCLAANWPSRKLYIIQRLHSVCLHLALCSMQFVRVACTSNCRLNYKDVVIFMGKNRNLIRKVDGSGNEEE